MGLSFVFVFVTVASYMALTDAHYLFPGPSKPDWTENLLVKGRPDSQLQEIQSVYLDVKDNGCDVNVCFLLSGGRRISPEVFMAQKNFVDLVVNIITIDTKHGKPSLGGFQYHDNFTRFSGFTRKSLVFKRRLHHAEQQGFHANPGPVIKKVGEQLPDRKEANKLILFSRGRRSFRRSVPLIAAEFRETKGSICAVAVDGKATSQLEEITGDINRVVTLEGFFTLSEIVIAIIADVCNLPCGDPGVRSC